MADADSSGSSGLPFGLDQLDPNALMSAFSNVTSGIKSATDDLQKQIQLGNNAFTQEAGGIQAQSEAQQGINTVKALAQSKQVADNRSAAAAFGTNPDAQTYVMSSMADSIISDSKDLDSRSKAIEDAASKTLLNDPLGYIQSMFTLPSMISARDEVQNRIAAKSGAIQQLQDMTTKQAQINAVVDELDATKNLKNVNDAVAAAATVQSAQASQKLAQFNMQGIDITSKLSFSQFQAAMSLNQGLIAGQDLQINKSRLAIEQDREGFYDQLKQEQLIKMQTYNEDQAALAGGLQSISKYTGIQYNPQDYRQLRGARKDAVDALLGAYDPKTDTLHFGDTTQAFNVFHTGNFKPGPGLQPIINQIQEQRVALLADPLNAQLKPAELDAKLQQNILENWQKEKNNIPTSGGMYSPPPLNKSINYSDTFKSMPLYKELEPLAINPQYDTKPDDVLTAASKLITAGTPAKVAAAQVSTLYQNIMMQNNELHSYNTLNINNMGGKAVPGFKTLVSGPVGGQILDMANQGAVESFLTRQQLAVQLSGLGSSGL